MIGFDVNNGKEKHWHFVRKLTSKTNIKENAEKQEGRLEGRGREGRLEGREWEGKKV